MVVQDMTVRLDNLTQPIVIEAMESKREVEVNAYLCNRLLNTVEQIHADNIKLTVSEQAFESISKYIGR